GQITDYLGHGGHEAKVIEKSKDAEDEGPADKTGRKRVELERKVKELKKTIGKEERLSDRPEKTPSAFRGFIDSDGSITGRPGLVRPEPDPSLGIQSSAAASQLGDYFEYRIEHAVNLPRQKSALLPIVTKDVEGTRVSIYNEAT